jgi:hypothetical protein
MEKIPEILKFLIVILCVCYGGLYGILFIMFLGIVVLFEQYDKKQNQINEQLNKNLLLTEEEKKELKKSKEINEKCQILNNAEIKSNVLYNTPEIKLDNKTI